MPELHPLKVNVLPNDFAPITGTGANADSSSADNSVGNDQPVSDGSATATERPTQLSVAQLGRKLAGDLPSLSSASWLERRRWLGSAWRKIRERHGWLEIWHGEQLASRIELGESRLRIGRDPCCELRTDVQGVSRVHAFVEKDRPQDRDWVLEDFDSANGVFWRDRRIRRIALRDGDVVQLGSALRGAPRLEYHQPRSVWEQVVYGFGLSSLVGSAVVVSGLMLFSTVGGGSRVEYIGGPVKIVSTDGKRVDEQEGAATALPKLDDYPLYLRQALLASEDARFGWNSGLDFAGTLRSLLRSSGGGSGITQQVARLYYPWVKQGNPASPWPWVRIPEPDPDDPDRDKARYPTKFETVARKIRELPVSWQLETRFTKNQILKMYLDRAFMGRGAHGFEQGAQLYFGKSARNLTLSESAYLVGLLPAPSFYNTCSPQPEERREERLKREEKSGVKEKPSAGEKRWWPLIRRDEVLDRMKAENLITDKQLLDAKRAPLIPDLSVCLQTSYRSYPFFSNYARLEMAGPRFSLNLDQRREGGNYYAVATVDPKRQALAEARVLRFLESEAEPIGISQVALISLDFSSGRILAYVGGKKYGHDLKRGESSWDRISLAQRQPGSTFKLFTYLAALEAGIQPQDLVSCARIFQLETGCRNGAASMTMSQGLALSENPVALHLADRVGFDQVVAMARKLGISTHLDSDPSMVLGGNEARLYEMAQAFAVVANGGKAVELYGVDRIYDLNICGSEQALKGCVPYTPRPQSANILLSPVVAKAMDSMLQRAVLEGTGRNAGVVIDARGKTGTTNNGRDVWFIGYSPRQRILTGIWMGNDDNRPAEAAAGALAARLWGQYMSAI